ncbi:hypothetical protein Tco_1155225 [Tanacetum coccineum]
MRSSSHVLLVPLLSSPSQVFASPVSDWGNIIRQTTSGVFVFKHNTYSEKFVNVFVRISFNSTIKLVSFDESKMVTLNGKFICGFRNGDYGTGSRSDNTVGSLHGYTILGCAGRSSLRSNRTLLFRRRSLRFRVRSGLDNGSISSELEEQVCIQGELLDGLENVFRKKKTFDCRKCSPLPAMRVTASKQIDFRRKK